MLHDVGHRGSSVRRFCLSDQLLWTSCLRNGQAWHRRALHKTRILPYSRTYSVPNGLWHNVPIEPGSHVGLQKSLFSVLSTSLHETANRIRGRYYRCFRLSENRFPGKDRLWRAGLFLISNKYFLFCRPSLPTKLRQWPSGRRAYRQNGLA